MKSIVMAVAATATVVSMTASTPAPAAAEPHNHRKNCVTKTEVWHVPPGLTRSELQQRWKVHNPDYVAMFDAYAYDMCRKPREGYDTYWALITVDNKGFVVTTGTLLQ